MTDIRGVGLRATLQQLIEQHLNPYLDGENKLFAPEEIDEAVEDIVDALCNRHYLAKED